MNKNLNLKIREIINRDDNLNNKFNKILLNHTCSKEHRCLDRLTSEICTVCHYGPTQLLECLENENNECPYLYRVGNRSFCECGIRNMIKVEFKS